MSHPKCKDHPYEVGPGVCPSCLRLRLLSLLSTPPPPNPPSPFSPRHVSSSQHHPLFFSTPQVGPAARGSGTARRFPSLFRSRKPQLVDLEDPPAATSSSWFSALLGRSKKARAKARPKASEPEPEPERDLYYYSHSSIEYTPSPAWRIAAPTPARRAGGIVPAWLSPIGGRRSQVVAGEIGEVRSGGHHQHRRSWYGGNGRSRKLADFGRFS